MNFFLGRLNHVCCRSFGTSCKHAVQTYCNSPNRCQICSNSDSVCKKVLCPISDDWTTLIGSWENVNLPHVFNSLLSGKENVDRTEGPIKIAVFFPQTALELNGVLNSSKKQSLFHHDFLFPRSSWGSGVCHLSFFLVAAQKKGVLFHHDLLVPPGAGLGSCACLPSSLIFFFSGNRRPMDF